MGEVCKERNSNSWLSVIWRVCNCFMSLFFALASYVQVSVSFITYVFIHLSKVLIIYQTCCVLTSDQWSRRRVMDGKMTVISLNIYLLRCLCHLLFTPRFCSRLVMVFLLSCVHYWAGNPMWQVDRWVWVCSGCRCIIYMGIKKLNKWPWTQLLSKILKFVFSCFPHSGGCWTLHECIFSSADSAIKWRYHDSTAQENSL